MSSLDKIVSRSINEHIETQNLRSKVRKIVSESVYRLINEREEKALTSREIQARLRKDEVNMIAIARKCPYFDGYDDDTTRSIVSKMSRGEMEIPPELVIQFSAALNASRDV